MGGALVRQCGSVVRWDEVESRRTGSAVAYCAGGRWKNRGGNYRRSGKAGAGWRETNGRHGAKKKREREKKNECAILSGGYSGRRIDVYDFSVLMLGRVQLQVQGAPS